MQRESSFNLPLAVWIEGRPPRELGTTDADGFTRPSHDRWFVRPLDPNIGDEHARTILAEVVRTGVPGLSLAGCRSVGDAGLEGPVAPALQFLELFGTAIAGVAWLSRMPALSRLSLQGTAVDDSALGAIAGLPHLAELDLGWTDITDAGLARLERHPTLTSLSLRATKITDAALKAVASIPNLRVLDLQETSVGDAGVALLGAGAARLEHLWLSYTRVTDRCVDDLARLAALRTLGLRVTRVKPERDAELARRLPNLGSGSDAQGLQR